ncbi:MAG: hypothetical protein V3U92_09800 [Cellulophaga sp.]
MKYQKLGLLFLFLGINVVSAQVKIGENPDTINSSSIIELESSSKALVLTRVSNTEMQNITPLHGALVYNTDTKCVHYYNSSSWINLCEGASSGFSFRDNNNGTYTLENTNGSSITFNGAPETITSLVHNLNGTYTYTNEAGNQTDISFTSIDNQDLTSASIDVNNILTISIENGDPVTVDLSSYLDNTDKQEITDFSYDDVTKKLSITIENGNTQVVDMSAISGDGNITSTNNTIDIGGEMNALLGDVTLDVADNAITAAKISNETILSEDIKDGEVKTSDIADANVTTAKIASGGNDKVLITDATGVVAWADKDAFGAIADQITIEGDGTTASPFIVKDLAIVTAKLADNAVTTIKIVDANVTTAKIADNAINSTKILNETILSEDIKDGEVKTSDIADSNVTTAKIADSNVTTTKIADANVTTAKIASGGNDKVLITDATGVVAWIDKSSLETTTTIANTITGHKIADYTNEIGGTAVDINETITTLTNTVTGHKIGDYNNESGGASISINETVTTFSQNDGSATGEITYKDEGGTNFNAQVVSANTNNQITVGTDGGAYFASPVKAMGKINANGTAAKTPLNASVAKIATGRYRVTFGSAMPDANYIIQLTLRDSAGAGNDDYDVSYNSQTTASFIVEIGDNDNGGGDRANRDLEFMFTVLDY